MLPLLWLLTACGSDPIKTAPDAGLVRPACRPAQSCMTPPGPLPTVSSGQRYIEADAPDIEYMRALRRQVTCLITHIVKRCQ
jgi:hypothetical protein